MSQLHGSATLNEWARALGGEVSGGQVLCPGPGHSHTDRSLSVMQSPGAANGFIVNSFAADDPIACRDYVRQKLGMPAWQPSKLQLVTGTAPMQKAADYIYMGVDGQPCLRVKRRYKDGKKQFFQEHWENGKWLNGKPSGEPIPYRLPELVASAPNPVFVCEGEKDADRVASHGYVATTAPEGAGKWRDCMAKWFIDREVFILEHNDDAGRRHAQQVAKNLYPVAASVRVVRFPGLPPTGDASDWLDGDPMRADTLANDCIQAPIWAPDQGEEQEASQTDLATPFVWIDPDKIPERRWLYGKLLIRKFVTATIAPGGSGKTTLTTVEGLAMASNRQLLHEAPRERARVWLWNGEDPLEELQRRVMAAAKHFCIEKHELEGWLFLNSGRDRRLVIARKSGETTIIEPIQGEMIKELQRRKIDVLIVDPFVSSHEVSENDNNAIASVVTAWAEVADKSNCAIHLVHHARKTNGREIEVEDARGASALIAGARVARVLNVMTKEEAERYDVENPFQFVKVADGKANMAPRSDKSSWHKIIGVPLGNGPLGTDGDFVAVMTKWRPPDPTDGVTTQDVTKAQDAIRDGLFRKDAQSPDWAGHPIGFALGIDSQTPPGRSKLKALLNQWIEEGFIETYWHDDRKRISRAHLKPGKAPELVNGIFHKKDDDDE